MKIDLSFNKMLIRKNFIAEIRSISFWFISRNPRKYFRGVFRAEQAVTDETVSMLIKLRFDLGIIISLEFPSTWSDIAENLQTQLWWLICSHWVNIHLAKKGSLQQRNKKQQLVAAYLRQWIILLMSAARESWKGILFAFFLFYF